MCKKKTGMIRVKKRGCINLFLRILLVSNPVMLGSEIYDLNSLVAAVPYEAVLSSLLRLPAVNLPSITERQWLS